MSIAHESNDLVLFGLQGGASWPGVSVDPRHGIIYISSNDIPWKIKLSRKSRKSLISKLLMSVKLKLEPGHDAYNERCSHCHGDTLQGGDGAPKAAKHGSKFLSFRLSD